MRARRQCAEQRERDIEAAPTVRGHRGRGRAAQRDLLLGVITAAKRAIGAEVHQLHLERRFIERPDIEMQVRHGGGIDLPGHKFNTGIHEIRVLLGGVAGDLHVGHVGDVESRRPRIHGHVGVRAAEQRNHIGRRTRGCRRGKRRRHHGPQGHRAARGGFAEGGGRWSCLHQPR
jgi:hypothetical protein